MAGDEIDERYAARFRRGYEPAAAPGVPDGTEGSGQPDPGTGRPPRAAGVVLAVLAAVLAAVATGGVAWAVLDPAFLAPPVPGPLAVARALAGAASGPFAVAAVVTLAGSLALLALGRGAAVTVSAGVAVALIALVVVAAAERVRLASLTAQGPVSSGGIPLPESALATYHQRVQTVGVLDELLPWLLLAAALEIVAAVFLTGALSARPSA